MRLKIRHPIYAIFNSKLITFFTPCPTCIKYTVYAIQYICIVLQEIKVQCTLYNVQLYICIALGLSERYVLIGYRM